MSHDDFNDPQQPDVHILPADNRLKQKLGHGGFDGINVKKAEKRLAEARTEFPSIARRELHTINASLMALYDPGRLLRDIFAASVDLKSNSGLFSYHVIAAVADSLTHFTEKLEQVDDKSLTIIQLHYDALQLVFDRGHDVMSQEQRVELLSGLQRAVKKYATNDPDPAD